MQNGLLTSNVCIKGNQLQYHYLSVLIGRNGLETIPGVFLNFKVYFTILASPLHEC